MENRGIEFRYGSRFQSGARKLLAGKAEPTPAPLAPSPAPLASYMCKDLKTGAIVSCQNPHTLVIIVAGMSCMMFLVTVAMFLLCWSVVRQRRRERLLREARGDDDQQSPSINTRSQTTNPATTPLAPVDSPEYDDAVLVQLPGDEKPQFFALPKPFVDGHDEDAKKPAEITGDGKSGEKESSQGAIMGESLVNHNRVAELQQADDPCVESSEGHNRSNPLFASR